MSAAAPFKTGFRAQPRLPCRGTTLVELLVVVPIIATIIGLLLPAVQAARESSRRSKCLANLRQIALACLMHETAQGALPTGGWGGAWVGDPDRGFDDRQPGGWVFNILDYAEEPALRAAGAGELSGQGKAEQVRRRLAAPLPLFVCSSRRPAAVWPFVVGKLHLTAVPETVSIAPPGEASAESLAGLARGDYAACMGSGLPPAHYRSGGSVDRASVGDLMRDSDWEVSFGPSPDGVVFRRSRVRLAEITDGLSRTLLVGEKFLDPAAMVAGTSPDDDQSLYSGHDRDVLRTGCVPPQADRAGYDPATTYGGFPPPIAFGSSHPAGCGMASCDGAVRTVSYDVDRDVFRGSAGRNDGLP